jgi:HAD superfamily hydrolase (TIGR01509 family)
MPLHLMAWERAFRDLGEPYQREYFDSLKGMHEEEIVSQYNREYGRDLDPKTVVFQKHIYFKKGCHQIKPIQPVVEVVEHYKDTLPMAVASGGSRENVQLTLDHLGLLSYFSALLTADDPLPPKPAPDLFLAAARILKVAPEQCLVFEDGELGLEAARRAGMPATDVRGYL